MNVEENVFFLLILKQDPHSLIEFFPLSLSLFFSNIINSLVINVLVQIRFFIKKFEWFILIFNVFHKAATGPAPTSTTRTLPTRRYVVEPHHDPTRNQDLRLNGSANYRYSTQPTNQQPSTTYYASNTNNSNVSLNRPANNYSHYKYLPHFRNHLHQQLRLDSEYLMDKNYYDSSSNSAISSSGFIKNSVDLGSNNKRRSAQLYNL